MTHSPYSTQQAISDSSEPSQNQSRSLALTRRKFLLTSAASLTPLVAGIWWYLEPQNEDSSTEAQHPRLEIQIEEGIRTTLPYLKLEPNGLRQFSETCAVWIRERGEMLSLEKVVEKYLKSTDFFQHGADESRELQFIAFYDPYLLPCYSPFANHQL